MEGSTLSDLFIRYESRLYKIACGKLSDTHDAQDAVQETFLKAWLHMDSLRCEAYAGTWLTRILYNECHNILRVRLRRDPPLTLEAADRLAGTESMDQSIQWLTFKQIIGAMNKEKRGTFLLHYFQGYTTREIAGMLYQSEASVKSRLFRTRRRLRLDDM